MFPSTFNSPVFLSIVPKSPICGDDARFGMMDGDGEEEGQLTWMTFGGSQLAHLKVASLTRSTNLRCAFPLDQGRIPIVM